MIVLRDLDIQAISKVTLNMREMDKREIYGLLPHDSYLALAYQVLATIRGSGRGRVAWLDDEPVAVVGFAEYRPGVWQIILFGTPEFRSVAIDVLRWVRETAHDLMTNHGGTRLQCDSHEDHHEAHRFLRGLGAHMEGPPMKRFGKDGSAYIRFVWLAGENDNLVTLRPFAEMAVTA